MARIRGQNVVDSGAGYVDVKFEYLVHEIETLVNDFKATAKCRTSDQTLASLKGICRAIREAKLHFDRVLGRYGANYEDSAKSFVDLAWYAADLASNTDCLELQKSLTRHAKEIEDARNEIIDRKCTSGPSNRRALVRGHAK